MNIPALAVFLPMDLQQRFPKLEVWKPSVVLEGGPEAPLLPDKSLIPLSNPVDMSTGTHVILLLEGSHSPLST